LNGGRLIGRRFFLPDGSGSTQRLRNLTLRCADCPGLPLLVAGRRGHHFPTQAFPPSQAQILARCAVGDQFAKKSGL
jgi:hypothetical protein